MGSNKRGYRYLSFSMAETCTTNRIPIARQKRQLLYVYYKGSLLDSRLSYNYTLNHKSCGSLMGVIVVKAMVNAAGACMTTILADVTSAAFRTWTIYYIPM
eukprot:6199422-Pleurochrysis_carterae.AAC.2